VSYIDPGAGSVALQALFAAVVGAGVYFRRMIAGIFGGLFKKADRHK
jgi:hypothetical protein